MGANNHMGSRFCQNRPLMDAVMAELKSRALLWLDSRTTAASEGKAAAEAARVPYLERDVFLDNIDSVDAVLAQLKELEALSRQEAPPSPSAIPGTPRLKPSTCGSRLWRRDTWPWLGHRAAGSAACGDPLGVTLMPNAPSPFVPHRLRTRGFASLGILELWHYRELLYFLIWGGRQGVQADGPGRRVGDHPAVLHDGRLQPVLRPAGEGPLGRHPIPIHFAALVPWTFFADGLVSRQTVWSAVRT